MITDHPICHFCRIAFRWDQRIFCFHIHSSSEGLHPSLKALCEVTGGFFNAIPSEGSIPSVVESLLSRLAPPFPSKIPFSYPLQLLNQPKTDPMDKPVNGGMFINGGPICCFQPYGSENRTIFRAMLLYVPTYFDNGKFNSMNTTMSSPMWCIPEAFFSSNKLDSLPPRNAQPVLLYSDSNNVMGSNLFHALDFIKSLNRLDDLMRTIQRDKYPGNGKLQNLRILQRDVYICEWLSSDGVNVKFPTSARSQEFFPVFVRGAGRSSTIDGTDNLLSIGILHVPRGCISLAAQSSSSDHSRLSTLTLLPPDANILLPLLIRAVEIENRSLRNNIRRSEGEEVWKHIVDKGSVATLIRKISDSSYSSNDGQSIVLDDHWVNEMKAYIYRVPPYCLVSVKRCLKLILPSSVHHILGTDTIEAITSQCFSRLCHQKIRAGEVAARDAVDRVDHRSDDCSPIPISCVENKATIGYGRYDRKSSLSSYWTALRTMNPPWKLSQSNPTASDNHLWAIERTRLLSNETPITTW